MALLGLLRRIPESPTPSPVADTAAKAEPNKSDASLGGLTTGSTISDFLNQYGLYLVIAVVCGLLFWLAVSHHRS